MMIDIGQNFYAVSFLSPTWPQGQGHRLRIFSDFALYFEKKNISFINTILLDYTSESHDILYQNKYRSQWPIFHSPVIYLYLEECLLYKRHTFGLFVRLTWSLTWEINVEATVVPPCIQPRSNPLWLLFVSRTDEKRLAGKKYSWLSLTRPRLSRITAYLEVKIWSLPKHENLTTCKKYCGKEEKWAISPLFHNFFNISLTSRVQLHIYLLNVVNRISFSSILQIWCVEVRISRSISESLLEFEITRVDCMRPGRLWF